MWHTSVPSVIIIIFIASSSYLSHNFSSFRSVLKRLTWASSIFSFHHSSQCWNPHSLPSLVIHYLLISDNDTDSDLAAFSLCSRSVVFQPSETLDQTVLCWIFWSQVNPIPQIHPVGTESPPPTVYYCLCKSASVEQLQASLQQLSLCESLYSGEFPPDSISCSAQISSHI